MINWTKDCTKVVVASQSLTASGPRRTLNAKRERQRERTTTKKTRERMFYVLKRPVGGRL